MMHAISQFGYRLQIYWLMLFNAADLFRRLNRLDWYQRTLDQWIESLHLTLNESVLEIGCATGELSERLANSGFDVTAVDSSQRMLVRAQAESAGKVRYLAGSITELPFDDNSFDAVISASLINVIDDKHQALKEMIRVCKPGGQVSFLVPSEEFGGEQLEVLINRLSVKDFSEAGLRMWHRAAKKLSAGESEELIATATDSQPGINFYLDDKVLSAVAIKPVNNLSITKVKESLPLEK